jgi:DNA-binding transcriptional LysR family regulator
MGPTNRPLDFEWLEDFVALASVGNFSRAAEARAIAQPALSRHIRALEEWVGVDLIDRSSHPVELTAAGARLLPLIKESLAGLEAARIKARAAHDEAAAGLRFAVTQSLSILFFPAWLAGLEARLRPGPVQTMSDHSRACEELMAKRQVQFLLCYAHREVSGPLDDGRFPWVCLGHDRLVPVSAVNHAGVPLFSLDRPGVVPVLQYSEASGLGRILRQRLPDLYRDARAPVSRRAEFSFVFTAHNALLLKTLAAAGRGMAWLPASSIVSEQALGALLMSAEPSWSLDIEIRLYRQPAKMSPIAERLWQLVGE